jgi:phosphohistidine phosphatase
LLLLRHAKSSWDDPKLEDHARPLNGRGRRAAELMREVLATLGILPDLILVSTARRTMQTLEILEPWAETPLVEPLDSLYLASGPRLLEILRGVPETVRSVLLVGHNPGLHDLAARLLGEQAEHPGDEAARALAEGYPTGALAEFSITGPWAELGTAVTRLERFIDPRGIEPAPLP